MDETNTACEWCGEEIKRIAVVCKHCQREVTPKYVDNPNANRQVLLIKEYFKDGLSSVDIAEKLKADGEKCENEGEEWNESLVTNILVNVLKLATRTKDTPPNRKAVNESAKADLKEKQSQFFKIGLPLGLFFIVPMFFLSGQDNTNNRQANLSSSRTSAEPWARDYHMEISQALTKNKVRGCGEYKYKKAKGQSSEYIVHCTRDGRNWLAYIVFTSSQDVMGPYSADLTE